MESLLFQKLHWEAKSQPMPSTPKMEKPHSSKIATRVLGTKAVASTMEFEGAVMRHLVT